MIACISCGGRAGQILPPAPAAHDIRNTVYLIGDAGEPHIDGEPVFDALVEDATSTPDPTPTILFLGDNVYPRGVPDEESSDRPDAERRLKAQVDAVVKANAYGIFVPGNHDWNFAGQGRRQMLLNEAEYGRSIGEGHVDFLPHYGCPGPEIIDIDQIRIIAFDSQWWLFPDGMEDVPDVCSTSTQDQVTDSIRSALANAGGRHVIVAAHHPMATGGPHGGYFTFSQHLFPLRERYRWGWIPLPGLGSIYPLARKLGVTDQDIAGTRYRRMRDSLSAAFADNPPLLYASGHDHSLQLISGVAGTYQVVSGSGNFAHVSPVSTVAGTLFAASLSGYMRLDFQSDGHVRLAVVIVDAGGNRTEAFAAYID